LEHIPSIRGLKLSASRDLRATVSRNNFGEFASDCEDWDASCSTDVSLLIIFAKGLSRPISNVMLSSDLGWTGRDCTWEKHKPKLKKT
jgi:hypothetical protein